MKKVSFQLKDKIVVVTGGMGQLGKQFCLSLLEYGAKVAVLDICVDENMIESTFKAYSRHPDLKFIPCDISSKQSLADSLEEISSHWGIPDGLINNAALDSPPNAPPEETGPFETYPESSWDRVMEVNVKGVFLSCQVFGGAMAEQKRGSIINIGSIYGTVSPDQNIYEYRRKRGEMFFKPVAYSASKSALINLTQYLSTYWGAQNIRVNLLTFGGVYNGQEEEFLKNYCAKVPLGRMADEDEYNGAVIFLLSDASSYMTGANMIIDGGWTAW